MKRFAVRVRIMVTRIMRGFPPVCEDHPEEEELRNEDQNCQRNFADIAVVGLNFSSILCGAIGVLQRHSAGAVANGG